MENLQTNFLGIKSINPFWLASAPPTDKQYNVERAFEAGWGGVVWKTVGVNPSVVNVNGPRYASKLTNERRVVGFNNIELISDRSFETNVREMEEVKKNWPDRVIIGSVMFPMEEKYWLEHIPEMEKVGIDGFELNFGCPHGMSERGMGSAVGQVPEYVKMCTEFCKKATNLPVIVKLTPNVTNVLPVAEAAQAGGADAVSLINTINSIMGVNHDTLQMYPNTGGKGSHGGYCGEAVKPIALHMVAEIARNSATCNLPISGIGGISTWKDAVDFLALGSTTLQVCTAAMVYGFSIIDELNDGLSRYLDKKGFNSVNDLVGQAIPSVTDWKYLNLNHIEKAYIDQDACIQCGRCHIACEDTSHQAITKEKDGKRHFEVMNEECVGCNLCVSVCPIENCITMVAQTEGVDARTGKPIIPTHADWTTHPSNPQALIQSN